MKKIKLFLLLLLALNSLCAQDNNPDVKKTKKAFMGVTLGISWGDGVEISEICTNYGADRAGLQVGDIIVAINGEATSTKEIFTSIVGKQKAGEEVEVKYIRGKEKMTTRVKLAESPYGISISGSDFNWNWDGNIDNIKSKIKRKEKAFLGVYPDTDWKERAVRVDGFPDNSAAREAGIQKGDYILRIENDETNTSDELRYAIAKYKPNDIVKITYKHNNKVETVKVKFGSEKVFDWDVFDGNESQNTDNKPSRTWSTYTFADGTEVSINDFSASFEREKIIVSFDSQLKKPFSIVVYDADDKEVIRQEEANLGGKYARDFNIANSSSQGYTVKIMMDSKEIFNQKVNR